jgi:DNA excision repair protein ERCC-8
MCSVLHLEIMVNSSLHSFSYKQDHVDSLGPSPSARSYSTQKRTGNAKKSQTMRKSQNLIHGQMQQRLHPGLSSSQNRAIAHYGAVTGLRTTTNGMYLLSSGLMNFIYFV